MSRFLTCFGEITEPSSRAFWDDFDDDEEGLVEREKLEWDHSSSTEESPEKIELLLLIEGLNVADFGKQVLLRSSSELCKINDKGISLHKIKGKKHVIGLLEENLSNSGEVTNLLLVYANKAENVITITIQPKVEYKSENMAAVKDDITFLRGVNSKLGSIKELESPNFIAGAAAGVCSYREVKNLPASAYIAYTDKSDLDTLSTAPILKLLRDIGIDCPSNYTPKVKEQSHLYM